MAARALVLGGGGSTGAAWQLSMLDGLRDNGVNLMDADLFVGTSAGALAAVNLAVGYDLAAEVATLRNPDRHIDDNLLVDNSPFVEALTELLKAGLPAERIRAELGARALAATGARSDLREIIADYLHSHEWPAQRLLIAAVDAESGELTAFDRDSGVPLLDALTAAGAVPIVWAPVSIGGRRYVDAFIRSPTNADLAAGAERIVVLAPIPEIRGLPGSGIAALDGEVLAITPDEASRAAIGRDQQDLSRQPAAVRAGLAQAAAIADAARAVWLG